MAPEPYVWPPSQSWDGDDGAWSSFTLRVGNPEQITRVLPSTAGQQTWVVDPRGCPEGSEGTSPQSTCSQSRGGFFNPANSSSWHSIGNHTLGLDLDLGYNATALYGQDTISLGLTDAHGGLKANSQVISVLQTDFFHLGGFGLGHQGTNVSNYSDPLPSFLTVMKNESRIPSLSWAYTAGASYRSRTAFGSLTFGGYDESRMWNSSLSISLAPDISRDLVVGIQSITSSTTNNDTSLQQTALLPTSISAFIDSTIPYIYLPIEACKQFETTFGLLWNETDSMYWVDDSLHQNLLSSNAKFTFKISNTCANSPTVDIILPYASFDLQVSPPFSQKPMRYFPLQRASEEAQYTLGRTFLQEAYVITDYERGNFSVSQSRFDNSVPSQLIPIEPKTATSDFMDRRFSIGIISGLFVLVLLVTLSIILARRWWRSRGQQRSPELSQLHYTAENGSSRRLRAEGLNTDPEIGDNSTIRVIREIPDNARVELFDARIMQMELPGSPRSTSYVMQELSASRSIRVLLIGQGSSSSSSNHARSKTKAVRDGQTNRSSSDHTKSSKNINPRSSSIGNVDSKSTSIITSRIKADIISSYFRKSLNLNRSLPPTPPSESPPTSSKLPLSSRRTTV